MVCTYNLSQDSLIQTSCSVNKCCFLSCRLSIKACVVFIPLLGITWLFGLLAPVHTSFVYISTILNSFQVFLLFLIFIVSFQTQNIFLFKLRWPRNKSIYIIRFTGILDFSPTLREKQSGKNTLITISKSILGIHRYAKKEVNKGRQELEML